MVFFAVKCSFRPASCWSVEVVKGAAGFRFRSPRVTDLTRHSQPWSAVITATVSRSDGRLAFSPRTSRSVAVNSGGCVPRRRACSDQYSTATKAWISRSRSVRSRTATDWTRPAESPRRIFSQRSGESLYPTRRSRIRRACCAFTLFMSILPGCWKAALTARSVISLNMIR